MLHTSLRRREPGKSDALSMLVDCHARIRNFAALAVSLSELEARHDEIAAAAARLHRYFAHALPLHAEDEDRSVLPRLEGRDPELDAALERMHAEHERIYALLAPQLAAWHVLSEKPAQLVAEAPRLGPLARQLSTLFEEHLRAEEQHVFPALGTHLDRAELAAIEHEIRERRRHTYR